MAKKATDDLTPEQRAVMEWRERLLNLPLQTEEEREALRQISEYLGITPQQVRELGKRLGIPRLPEPETAPPAPQEPTPPKARKKGSGRKPTFDDDQQTWLQERYSLDLKADARLAKHDAAIPHVKQLAKDKFGIDAGRNTLLDQVIRPVLRPPNKNQQ